MNFSRGINRGDKTPRTQRTGQPSAAGPKAKSKGEKAPNPTKTTPARNLTNLTKTDKAHKQDLANIREAGEARRAGYKADSAARREQRISQRTPTDRTQQTRTTFDKISNFAAEQAEGVADAIADLEAEVQQGAEDLIHTEPGSLLDNFIAGCKKEINEIEGEATKAIIKNPTARNAAAYVVSKLSLSKALDRAGSALVDGNIEGLKNALKEFFAILGARGYRFFKDL